MHLNIALARHSLAMNEDVVEVRRRKVSHRTKQVRDASVERRWCVGQALRHDQPLPKHTAWGADCCEGDIFLPHTDLIVSISQIQGREDGTALHAIDDDILPRYRRLSRYRCSVQLVVRMHNAPPSCCLFDTEGGGTVRGDRLPHVPCTLTSFKEVVDELHLVTGQWPLPRDAILRAGWRKPRSTGNSHGTSSGKTSLNSRRTA